MDWRATSSQAHSVRYRKQMQKKEGQVVNERDGSYGRNDLRWQEAFPFCKPSFFIAPSMYQTILSRPSYLMSNTRGSLYKGTVDDNQGWMLSKIHPLVPIDSSICYKGCRIAGSRLFCHCCPPSWWIFSSGDLGQRKNKAIVFASVVVSYLEANQSHAQDIHPPWSR